MTNRKGYFVNWARRRYLQASGHADTLGGEQRKGGACGQLVVGVAGDQQARVTGARRSPTVVALPQSQHEQRRHQPRAPVPADR